MDHQPPPSVEIREVTKRFGDVTAVDGVSLEIRRGELFALLGPSGCGKTTLLRVIGGLEAPTTGTVRIDGSDVTRIAPHLRPAHMVFQQYALFPHLSVADNVAFGLRYKRDLPRAAHAARVGEALALVRLAGLEKRFPHQLSGGQRQRVALARALVLEPQVLLLDEPLAALDPHLREEVQVELKHLQRTLGITFLFVTHDREEALGMSDRVAVMRQGRVEQVGTPAEVFERPATRFAAEFLGAANFFPAEEGGSFLVRPEKLRLCASHSEDGLSVPVTVEERIYQGVGTTWIVRGGGGERFVVWEQNTVSALDEPPVFHPGSSAFLCWTPKHAVLIREEG